MTALVPIPESVPVPKLYEQAKQALAACVRVDECKTWADKAAALASYARQANDQELETYARRVRARAIRREGELLDEVEPSKGGRPKTREGTLPSFSRSQAAADAGISSHQLKTALRVANVPQAEFEAAVDGSKPASITALAERGTQARPRVVITEHLKGRAPEDFAKTTRALGEFREFAAFAAQADIAAILRGADERERRLLIDGTENITAWLKRFKEAADV